MCFCLRFDHVVVSCAFCFCFEMTCVSESTLSLFDFPPFCEHTWFLFVAIGSWVFKPGVSICLCQIMPVCYLCRSSAKYVSLYSCLPVILTLDWYFTWPCWILCFGYFCLGLCLTVGFLTFCLSVDLRDCLLPLDCCWKTFWSLWNSDLWAVLSASRSFMTESLTLGLKIKLIVLLLLKIIIHFLFI